MSPADVSPNSERRWDSGVRVGVDADRSVVYLSGEHDLATKDAVLVALEQAVAASASGDVVVDLIDVTFMDASTLGVMVSCQELSRERARRLVVRVPEGLPRQVIELCGLAEMIDGDSGDRLGASRATTALESWVEVPPADRDGGGSMPPQRAAPTSDPQQPR